MQSLSLSMSPPQMSTELQSQLSQFGLNPFDWSMHPVSADAYCVIHRADHDLVLIGQVRLTNGRARWTSLELLEDEISA